MPPETNIRLEASVIGKRNKNTSAIQPTVIEFFPILEEFFPQYITAYAYCVNRLVESITSEVD